MSEQKGGAHPIRLLVSTEVLELWRRPRLQQPLRGRARYMQYLLLRMSGYCLFVCCRVVAFFLLSCISL